jgi:hypothetical protein
MGYRSTNQRLERDSFGIPNANFCQANEFAAMMGCLWDSDGILYLNNAGHPIWITATPEMEIILQGAKVRWL